ncbi:SAM-dependent methyltransferase [Nitratireductor mangrovi]|uniref:Protein-L-isoaspartate O-methyltransferase n=1 Tax=Nitratireductor mangrovi TaxID=2599600 RepID=A0A5B8L5N4_9HYPH|nr:SAM-dependent methyltransferase [Nitratireductor mangrovi]QDZ03053.1 SAM-dependent methyltransferase [Nitratireductor mangrovi]
MSDLADIKAFYARLMAASSGSTDPRLERIFALVPREAFLPPGPWTVFAGGRPVETPSADPAHLYQNVLVALNRAKSINNGEPFLHAAWIGRVMPQPGEIVCHVGAGTGYYSAILSMLVLPAGMVHAYEIDRDLARHARDNLEPFENAHALSGDAVAAELPACDIIYVSAGLAAPPLAWLDSLNPGGRMVFPWRPAPDVGLAVVVRRRPGGAFSCEPFMGSWFIPCAGAESERDAERQPSRMEGWATRSLWRRVEREPDETATAIFRDIWFSAAPRGD